MFIKTKNTRGEEVIVNTDNINYIVIQNDGDVYIHFGEEKERLKVIYAFVNLLMGKES